MKPIARKLSWTNWDIMDKVGHYGQTGTLWIKWDTTLWLWDIMDKVGHYR